MKKLIITLSIVFILLISMIVLIEVVNYKEEQQAQAEIEEQTAYKGDILDDDDTLSQEELDQINANYPEMITSSDEATEYLKTFSTFATYETTEEDGYYLTNATSDSGLNITYAIYPDGIYFQNYDEVEHHADGIVSSPDIAIKLTQELAGTRGNDDIIYDVTMNTDEYQVELVSMSQVDAGGTGSLGFYNINFDGTYCYMCTYENE